MRPSQKLAIRASEIREKLSTFAEIDGSLTDEQRSSLESLRTEYRDCEAKITAALISEDRPVETRHKTDGEGREMRALIERCNVGVIFDSAVEKRSLSDGPEKELQTHHGLGENQIPLALLETRAVSPAPSDVGQNQSEIIPYVFPQSCAAFLSVDMPSVPVGEAVYPVLTSTLSVGTPAENAEQAETTGAFSADVMSPSRIQASFFYSREDRARFAGMDAALRQNLSDGLSDGLDKQIIAGTSGLLTGTNLADHNVSAVTDFANYISNFGYGRVDGRYASMTSELRSVMGAATYAHAGNAYRNSTTDRNAVDRLSEITGGIKVSSHVPAVASKKQNAVIRLGSRRDMVSPVWEGVTIIPDEITKVKSGQIQITAIMLHAIKILRPDGFYKQQAQIVA